jgi:hypothetical protein
VLKDGLGEGNYASKIVWSLMILENGMFLLWVVSYDAEDRSLGWVGTFIERKVYVQGHPTGHRPAIRRRWLMAPGFCGVVGGGVERRIARRPGDFDLANGSICQ